MKKETRKLVSTCMAFAFAGMALTGLIAVLGVRGKWMDIHLMFGLFFIVAAGVHLQINWPILKKYFEPAPKEAKTLFTPMVIAIILSVLMLFIGLVTTPSKAFRDTTDRPRYRQTLDTQQTQTGAWLPGQGQGKRR
ncbi:MAG: DUF4405 domain-containing protein [Desulfatibacillum sp.]|nr:DUF4405 domain-containing protein [Desulfatibacillum sp.]